VLANVTLIPQKGLLDKTYEKKKHANVLPAFGEPSGHACRVREEAHGSELNMLVMVKWTGSVHSRAVR